MTEPTLFADAIKASTNADYCCRKCFDRTAGTWPFPSRMILCPTCGNKRCPKASDHDLACTDSNEPGQPGSRY